MNKKKGLCQMRNCKMDICFWPHTYSSEIFFKYNFALNHWQGIEKEEDIIKGRTVLSGVRQKLEMIKK